ncbi:energy-coupling factor transporter transmembrane component T family protein [Mycetocola spongiae]|uniref:energy-coupling factor transporter transmembrane component T family protein n=1 Tax=Mycetocola spongiae TaxID=2859226 RepID=UPI001CF19F98|nr:energy-coupling factor transporter transmembrane component T [Mycetocola spongiae]UCR89291.1 energy-coupling factor transporter transmembrane protein EcfT [Mycetocola spongiae]
MSATTYSGVVTAERAGGIHRTNAVSRLLVPVPITLVLLLTLDWVSAATALAALAILLPFTGITARQFFLRTLPVWIAAPAAAVTMLLYGRPSGTVYWEFGVAQISDGSIEIAVATMLRLLAIALPAVVLFITVDPTDLADGLAQILHLPARFVLGALAGLRMVGLFMDDWRQLELARRARGVADTGRVRRLLGMCLAILVLSIRRGSKLAMAMEARGFGGDIPRTWARESTLGWRDAVLAVVGLAVAALIVIVTVSTGHWNFVFD